MSHNNDQNKRNPTLTVGNFGKKQFNHLQKMVHGLFITADPVDGMHTDQNIMKCINLESIHNMKLVTGRFTQVMVLNFD
jgi:hypothetical protein